MPYARRPTKAERDALRRDILSLGCTLETVAREMTRRWRIRPREAYRHAHGWSQDEVARQFELARVTGDISSPGRTAPRLSSPVMSGVRIGEYERWPAGGRRPSVYALVVLAQVFETSVDHLLDYLDHRELPDTDRAVLAAIHEAHSAAPPVTTTGLRPTSNRGSSRAS